MVDPRGSGLLFFMFIRPQPYTCLGIEWLTQGGVAGEWSTSTIFHVYRGPKPNPTPVWELNAVSFVILCPEILAKCTHHG